MTFPNPGPSPRETIPHIPGELYVDPATGAVDRITLEAELSETDPVTASAMAVQYGPVDIDGKTYICPVHAAAVSTARSTVFQPSGRIRLERHINLVSLANYHRFGSTVRIFNATPPAVPR